MGGYAGAVVAPAVGAFVLDRRVPDMSSLNVSLHVDEEGWFDRLAAHGGLRPSLPAIPWREARTYASLPTSTGCGRCSSTA